MKKEQIENLLELQKAFEYREKVVETLGLMLKNVDDDCVPPSRSEIIIVNHISISSVSSKEEMKEQIEFLLTYHTVKLQEQREELDSYIISKKID